MLYSIIMAKYRSHLLCLMFLSYNMIMVAYERLLYVETMLYFSMKDIKR